MQPNINVEKADKVGLWLAGTKKCSNWELFTSLNLIVSIGNMENSTNHPVFLNEVMWRLYVI